MYIDTHMVKVRYLDKGIDTMYMRNDMKIQLRNPVVIQGKGSYI